MDYYISKADIRTFFKLPKNFDWDLVDQEVGFAKVFDFIPKEVYLQLKESSEDSEKEIYRLLTKAAVIYSFVLNIPQLKVHISNFGISEFKQDKVSASPWYDVRDLGLSLIKTADTCLSQALTFISEDDDLEALIPFFKSVSIHIPTPAIFQEYYSINNSPEVFKMLQRYINKALQLFVYDKISKECIETIVENDELNNNLREALVFYALYLSSSLPAFVFTSNAVVIQYEELPWQKSQVLDPHLKKITGENFKCIAEDSLKIITDYIKNNRDEFECYQPPQELPRIHDKDSGIFIM